MERRPASASGRVDERGPVVRKTPTRVGGRSGGPLQSPSPRRALPNNLFVVAAIVLGLAALLYGYALGERRTTTTEASSPTSSAVPTAHPVPEASPSLLTETWARFVTERGGHVVPEGATEYLNGNWIEAIAVDAEGFIWSTGPAGVVRWNPADGGYVRQTTADGAGPLGGEQIATSVFADVWVSSSTGLSHWNGREWTRDARRLISYNEPADVSDTDYPAVATMADGSVWVATSRWGSDAEFLLHTTEGELGGRVTSFELPGPVQTLHVAPDGALWVAVAGQAWRLDDGEWVPTIDTGLSAINDLAVSRDGRVWLVTETRARVWSDGVLTGVPDERDALVPDRERGLLRWITVDDANVPWVVAITWDNSPHGVSELINLDSLSRHAIPGSNPTKPVVGTDGTVWMGTSDGLVGFDGTTWTTLRIPDDPPLEWARDIVVDDHGTVWIAGADEILTWEGSTPTILTRDALPFPPETTMEWWGPEPWVATRPGAPLWAGFGCRAARLDSTTWLAMDMPPDIGASYCRALDHVVGPDGSLWMLAEHLGGTTLQRTVDTGWLAVADAELVEAIAVSDHGAVWGAGAGVKQLVDGQWSMSLGGLAFSAIVAEADGTVWTSGCCGDGPFGAAGVWRLDDNVWSRIDPTLAADLEIGPDGTVWAIGGPPHRTGAWPIDPPGDFRLVAHTQEFSALAAAPDGGLWLAGPGRLLHLPAHTATESTGS